MSTRKLNLEIQVAEVGISDTMANGCMIVTEVGISDTMANGCIIVTEVGISDTMANGCIIVTEVGISDTMANGCNIVTEVGISDTMTNGCIIVTEVDISDTMANECIIVTDELKLVSQLSGDKKEVSTFVLNADTASSLIPENRQVVPVRVDKYKRQIQDRDIPYEVRKLGAIRGIP
jgi:hypothetical protein